MQGEEIHPGSIVAGKYRVRAILNRDQGLLVEAFHTEFDQQVVVKILHAGTADQKETERFRREARTLGKLQSEHVARIIDVGSDKDGSFYLVRQFLEGADLASYVKQNGARPLDEAVLFILQTAEAVAETHSHNIILRDLRPEHICVSHRVGGAPLVKITDFGTAKLLKDVAAPAGGSSLTATAMFGMSPYSSPEMVRKAKNVDVRTDIWSMGAILYLMLAGRPPFGGDIATMMLQIAKNDPTPLSKLRPDLPREIDNIIGWCMAKDVDARFKHVHAFAHALTPFAPAEGKILIERSAQIRAAMKHPRGGIPAAPPSSPNSIAPPAPRTPTGRPLPNVRPPNRGGSSPRRLPPVSAPPKRGGESVGQTGRSEDSGVTRLLPLDKDDPKSPAYDPYAAQIPKPSKAPTFNAPLTAPSAPALSSRPPGLMVPGSRPAPSFHPGMSPSMHSAAPGPHPALLARQPPSGMDRRVVFGALAAMAVMLPVVLVLLLRDTQTETAGPVAGVAPQAPQNGAVAPVQEPGTPQPTPPPGGTPVPPPNAGAQPTKINADDLPGVEPKAPPPPPPSYKLGAGTPPPPPPAAAAPPPPPPPPPAASSDDPGKLMAIATGGSCTFLVNGSAKGTSSTLTVELKPGSYSVTCKPKKGAAKSRSVQIQPGKTSMLTFKL